MRRFDGGRRKLVTDASVAVKKWGLGASVDEEDGGGDDGDGKGDDGEYEDGGDGDNHDDDDDDGLPMSLQLIQLALRQWHTKTPYNFQLISSKSS